MHQGSFQGSKVHSGIGQKKYWAPLLLFFLLFFWGGWTSLKLKQKWTLKRVVLFPGCVYMVYEGKGGWGYVILDEGWSLIRMGFNQGFHCIKTSAWYTWSTHLVHSGSRRWSDQGCVCTAPQRWQCSHCPQNWSPAPGSGCGACHSRSEAGKSPADCKTAISRMRCMMSVHFPYQWKLTRLITDD